jgi:hypothetical protein
VVPLVLTTQLVRIAVMRIFPCNTVSVGDAALSLSGALILRDVALGETVAQRPLVAIREVDAAFDWEELVSRRIRKIEVRGVTVYAGTGSRSQIGLLDLLYASNDHVRRPHGTVSAIPRGDRRHTQIAREDY